MTTTKHTTGFICKIPYTHFTRVGEQAVNRRTERDVLCVRTLGTRQNQLHSDRQTCQIIDLQLHIHVATFVLKQPMIFIADIIFFGPEILMACSSCTYHHQNVALQWVEVELSKQSDVEDPNISDACE